FPSEVRPDFVNTEVLDAVHGLISNKYFSVGAQTASDKLLKKINRGHTFDDVLNAIDLILDYGYGIDLDFIFGLPEETREDKLKTIEFFKETLVSGKNIRIHTHTFMPLPGTPYENMPPGELDKEIEVIISKLEGQKKAFGQHREQAKIYKNL
ncbi:MAG: radical SAM protein, partial [Promethearchaeota archaeon]